MDEKLLAARFDDAAANLGRLNTYFSTLPISVKSRAHEIRLRLGRPLMLSMPDADVFITETGMTAYTERSGLLHVYKKDMEEAFRIICNSSVYSHQQEIKNGFVILKGGHRAGICGTAVVEAGSVQNIRDISSINLRIAREIPGAADETVQAVLQNGFVEGALIFGPPGCGKTTVLRDLARQLSMGQKLQRRIRVAVVDERGEIAATFQGTPQNNLGPCCDILDGYPKAEGIIQAVRSLSPDVVICDEIGGEDESRAVLTGMNAGVCVIATAHAGSIEELRQRPQIARLIQTGAFKRALLLKGRADPGKVKAVYEEGELYGGKNSRNDSSFFSLRGRGGAGVY